MHTLNTYSKRRSVEKFQPELPKRKISQNSRDSISGSGKGNKALKNRTQYQNLQLPENQLQNYKRKNILTQQLNSQSSHQDAFGSAFNKRSSSKNLSTNRTKQTNFGGLTEGSVHANAITSRFMIEQGIENEEGRSLVDLININKSQQSNPLINTARLNLGQQKCLQSLKKYEQNNEPKQLVTNGEGLKIQQQIIQEDQQLLNQNQQDNQDDDESSSHSVNGQNNFDILSGSCQQSISKKTKNNKNKLKAKHKKNSKNLMPAPKIQSYTSDKIIRPLNWRQNNRYQPQTQEQSRMALQRYVRQKQSLQFHRQQKQMTSLIQEYQLSKNALLKNSKKKSETNKLMQKIYKDKRQKDQRIVQNSSKTKSISLPHLKPLKQIIIPQVNELYENEQLQETKKKNIMATILNEPKLNPIKDRSMKYTFSLSRLGFGTQQPRHTYQEQIKQSQLQTVEKIERKLREKGILFNSNSIKKGLINIKDNPMYKISQRVIEGTKTQNNAQKNENNGNFIQLPTKQLPTNVFYKLFPL